ncbi:MAG: CinA family protein [Legionella sp.]|nr:CinA family protein [Legionella sp.]
MNNLCELISLLSKNHLFLATAESCTAGKIVSLLAENEGCGGCLDVGFVVYSAAAKKRILQVRQSTIDQYTLTSEEVAHEMAAGVFASSIADIVIATTGLAGTEPIEGIEPGTICFAWGYKNKSEKKIFTEKKIFSGERESIQYQASYYALEHMLHHLPEMFELK